MRGKRARYVTFDVLAGLLLSMSLPSGASTFNVVIDSTGLSNPPTAVTLAFDFIDGDALPDNTVTLALSSAAGWTPAAPPSTGDLLLCPVPVAGAGTSGPWTFSDASGGCFDYPLFVDFTQAGTSLSFSFTTSDNFPTSPSLSPDSFQMAVLAANHLTPLITTDAPGGSNVLFLYNFSELGLESFTPDAGQGFSFRITPAQGTVPEPATLALLVAGLGAMLWRRRFD